MANRSRRRRERTRLQRETTPGPRAALDPPPRRRRVGPRPTSSIAAMSDEAEENNLFGTQRGTSKWRRWDTCSLCEQDYHGVVSCALGWACWKTYVGRPVPRTVNGTGHTDPSEFCATSI